MLRDYVFVRHGCSERVGYTMAKNGKRTPKYKYRETYKCRKGEFAPAQWKEAVLEEVRKEHKEDLLERIKEHVKEHVHWLKPEENEEYALECLCCGAYEFWPEFEGERTIIWM